MSSTQSILQDVLRRRRGEFLLDHTETLELLRQNLTQDEPDTSVYVLSGRSGAGKTALARAICRMAAGEGALIAWADELYVTPLRVMVRWARHLMRGGAELPYFSERYHRYGRLAHQIQSDPFYVAGLTDVLEQLTAYHPLRCQDHMETIGGALIDIVAGQSEHHLRYLNRRLEREDDLDLLRSPTKYLTHDLIRDLNLLSQEHPVLLTLDSFEQTEKWLDEWLDGLIGPQSSLSRKVRFVVTTAEIPTSRAWETRRHLSHYVQLKPLSEETTIQLCQRYGMDDAEQVALVHSLSGGLPGPASMLASSFSGSVMREADDSMDEGSDNLIATALGWINSLELAALVQLAAIPRAWDTQLLTRLLGSETASSTSLNWLLSRPYVQSTHHRWSIIPFARREMLAYLAKHAPGSLRDMREQIIGYHTEALEHLANAEGDTWRNGDWIAHQIERTYHRLCLDPAAHIPEAAGDFLKVLLFHLPRAAHWIDAWRGAGEDTRNDALLEWVETFEACISRMDSDGWFALLPLYERLKALADISPGTLALIHLGETIAGEAPLDDLPCVLDTLRAEMPDEPGSFHLAAVARFRQGDTDGAAHACRQALAIAPTCVPAHSLLGDIAMAQGQPETAITSYRAVVEQPSDHYASEPAMFRLGLTLIPLGAANEALEACRLAFRDDPPDQQQAIAYLERGAAYHQMRNLDAASGDYVNALGMAGGAAGWTFAIHVSQASARRCRGKLGQALNDCEKAFNWLLERPDPSAPTPGKAGLVAAHNNRGNIRLLMGEPEGAIWDYEQAIRRERESPTLYCNRGMAYLIQHMAPRAEREFDAALALDAENDVYHFCRGLARAHQGRFNEARDDFKRASQLNSRQALYVHNTGLAYYHGRSLRRAIAAFRQAIELNPAHANGFYHLGLCHLDLGEYAQAITAFNGAIAGFEDAETPPVEQPAGAYLERGLAHFRLGNHDLAIHDFGKVSSLISRSRIGASLPAGRSAYRLDQFGFAISPVPRDAIASQRLGEVYSAQGRYEEAIACFDEALRLSHGDYTDAYTHRGHARAALKQHRDAILDYGEALKRVPTSSSLHIAIGNEHKALSQLEDALGAYDRAIQLVPTSGEAYLQMGHVSLALAYTGRAIDSYRMAELFGQHGVDLYLGRAEALNQRGLCAQALADYDRALRLDATLPKAHWGRARVMWKTGKIGPALENTFTAFGFLLRQGLQALTGSHT